MSEDAVLNANYLLARLRDDYDLLFDRLCMHEFVLSARSLKRDHGISALDVAKRLMDYGFHPPTIYFPLIVPEALMIEPTETEPKETLDEFVEAMRAIAAEAVADPQVLKDAPHRRPVRRLDEVKAAKHAVVKYGFEEHPDPGVGAGRGRSARSSEGRVRPHHAGDRRAGRCARRGTSGRGVRDRGRAPGRGAGPEGRPLLQEILLERAAEEESFQRAVRRRFETRGWTSRTLARFEGLWRDDRAEAVAAAIEAGPEGEARLRQELRDDAEERRAGRGRARRALAPP